MKSLLTYVTLTILGLAVSTSFAAEKMFKATCPVCGKAAQESITADYQGAKLYFATTEDQAAFAKTPAKYTSKSNFQLFQTGQAKQVKCPFSGGKLNPEIKVAVGEIDVQFCCNSCKGHAAKLAGDAQVEELFSLKPFSKGFEIVKK